MIISFKGNGGGGGGYVLPTATANRLGGIKVGSGLTVQNDGTLSAEGGGGVTSAETEQMIEQAMAVETARTEQTYAKSSAFNDYYTSAQTNSAITEAMEAETARTEQTYLKSVPVATTGSTGVVKVGSGLSIDANGVLSADGGGSGGGDYIVTEALSSITNPTEGMIAYVPAHYEDRGATHIKFELIDTSENVELWYPDLIYFDNFYSWDRVLSYSFNATDNENSHISFRKEDGFRKPDLYSSDAWFSLSTGSRVLVKVSGATIEFLVDSGLTISSTQNPDDKFTVTTSTGLTPVRGMTYVYHSGWILKDVDFAYDRLQDYMQSCVYLSKNPIGEQELAFGLWGINFDTKFWFGINAEGQPLGWCGYDFSCVSTEDENQKKYEFFVEGNLSEGVASWNPNARVTDMKLLDFIRIPVLAEDAVLTEDIEYEGQIVAHSGDTVASAGTIVAETDLYDVAAYGYVHYGKKRVIFTFVQSGDCSWNSEQQKVIVNEGPGLDAYGDLQNIHRVAVEGEPEDYYISATMDYNGTLYRGSWKQHDRYTRWITLSWTQIQ